MEEYDFKKSYFTIMVISFVVACIFVMFGYFASEGFAQRAYQQNDTGRDHFSRLDQNRDGRISEAEFPGPDEHFICFDRDSDGYLSDTELPKDPPPPKLRSFSSLDANGDGILSEAEFTGADGYPDEDALPKGPPCGDR